MLMWQHPCVRLEDNGCVGKEVSYPVEALRYMVEGDSVKLLAYASHLLHHGFDGQWVHHLAALQFARLIKIYESLYTSRWLRSLNLAKLKPSSRVSAYAYAWLFVYSPMNLEYPNCISPLLFFIIS